MKQGYKGFTVFLIIFLIKFNTSAQTSQPVDVFKNQIVLNSGDTLTNVQLLKNRKNTNEDFITVKKGDLLKKINASEIISYHDGKNFFVPQAVEESQSVKLVDFKIIGPIKFGVSYSPEGKMNFYLQNKPDAKVTNLEKYKYNIEGFLQNYLEDFNTVKEAYNKDVYYEYSNLANFISAYNMHKQPGVFLKAKYRSRERLKAHPFLGATITNVSLDEGTETFSSSIGQNLGILVYYKYSKKISPVLQASYQRVTLASENYKLNYQGVNFEPGVNFIILSNKIFRFSLIPAGMVVFNLNNQIRRNTHELYINDRVDLHQFSYGYSFTGVLSLKDKFHFILGYSANTFRTYNFLTYVLGDSGRNTSFNNLRLGFSYSF